MKLGGFRRAAVWPLALALLLTASGCQEEAGNDQSPPGRLGALRTADDGVGVNKAAAAALEDMASSMAELTSSLAALQDQVEELSSAVESLEAASEEAASEAEAAAASAEIEEDDDASSSSSEAASSEEPDKAASAPKVPNVAPKLRQAEAQNEDVRLWLQIPGTTISDVVVQGETNTDYSRRNWLGSLVSEKEQENAVVLDFECQIGSGTPAAMPQNTVIYGVNFGTWLSAAQRSGWSDFYTEHYNAKSGKLEYASDAEEARSDELSEACERLTLDDPNGPKFSQLLKFANINFARNTPYIYLTTGAGDLIYEVFAVCYTNSKTDPPYNLAGYSDAFFTSLVSQMKQKSIYQYDVEVSPTDKLLTLSTDTFRYAGKRDTYGERAKFVVMARLMGEDETYRLEASLSANPAPVGPTFPG